jgi:hypothetical protein
MPLDFIPAPRRIALFWLFFTLTLAFFAVFGILDQPLRTPAAPNGIVSFEIAGSTTQAAAIRDSWSPTARLYAAFGLGLDFLFMPVYATALSLSTLLAATRRKGRAWLGLGAVLAWGAYLAAGLDVVENSALLHILLQGAALPMPQIAAICAMLKFVVLLIGIGYALLGWLLPQK